LASTVLPIFPAATISTWYLPLAAQRSSPRMTPSRSAGVS
jgi:hypothetical protein